MNRPPPSRDPLLQKFRPPSPPETLRARALRAARLAGAEKDAGAPSPWDQLWESRPLRWTWAGCALVLCLVHLALGYPGAADNQPGETLGLPSAEVLQIVAMSPIREDASLVARLASARPTPPPQPPVAPARETPPETQP